MIHSLPHQRIHISIPIVLLALFAVSCGSYQSASYYDDGIYADRTERVQINERPGERQVQPKQNNYGDYFGQKADEYGEILESEVFTDIDGYYGNMENDSLEVNPNINYYNGNNDYNGYAAWGDNPTNVSINIYDYGWGSYNYGWASPFYGGYYGGYYGYYNPWRWGYHGYYGYPGYGYAYGWGSYYRPYYYSSYYYSPYYGYNNYYGRNYYAYNAGRRGIYGSNSQLGSNNVLRGRSNLNGTTSRYRTGTDVNRNTTSTSSSRYRTSTQNRVNVDALDRNSSYRTSRSTRVAPNTNSSTARSSQGTTPGNSTYRSTTPNNSTYRSSTSTPRATSPSSSNVRSSNSTNSTTRSSGSTYRSSSSSPSSSSGTIRSSSSSSSQRSSSGRSGGIR